MNTIQVPHSRAPYTPRGIMAAVAASIAVFLGAPPQAQASPIEFTLPFARTAPNPCTGGFVLMAGTLRLAITTSGGSVLVPQFTIGVQFQSAGTGDDARADGTFIMDGTQKPRYIYSSETSVDAAFESTPQIFGMTIPVTDFLIREGVVGSDIISLDTVIDLNFTSGVPTAPELKQLVVRCE